MVSRTRGQSSQPTTWASRRRNLETIVILLLLLAWLSIDVRSAAHSAIEETKDFSASDEVLRYEMTASAAMDSARLRVRTKLKAGEAHWVLLDPTGRERMTGHGLLGTSRTDTGAMEPVDGVWTLEIRLREATGRLRVSWDAR